MIKIYGRKNCDFCKAAVRLMKTLSEEYEYIDITDNEELKDFVREEWKKKGVDNPTVPLIIENGKTVGGYTEFSDNRLKNPDFFI